MNWIKRAYEQLSRLVTKASYKGAEVSRLLWDWIVSPITADQEVRKDGRRLRARARDLAKNSPVIRQYLALLTNNVIGPHGMKLQAQVKNNDKKLNKAINDKIETAWEDWGRSVTTDGKQGLIEFSNLVLKTVATDGEAFVRKVYGYPNKHGFALELLDADLLDTEFNQTAGEGRNEIRLGVEVDSWGKPLAYWFSDKHPAEGAITTRHIRIPADQVMHLYHPERTKQTRGVTWFNSIMVPLRMLDGYLEAELMAARTASAKMGWLQYKDATQFEAPDPKNPIRIEATPGIVEMLPPGLEFQPWSPDHPTSSFPQFVKAVLRQIATGLRVSYNALANDLEGVNYSSMRSGLLIERDEWRCLQRWWIDRFQRPVYEEWLAASLLAGGLVLDSRDFRKFLEARWTPRGWAWVDPEKDINASVIAITNGLASRTEVLAERGADYEEVLEQLKHEKELAEEAGLEFTGQAQPQSPGEQQKREQPKRSFLEDAALVEILTGRMDATVDRLSELAAANQRPQVIELRPNITVESTPLTMNLEVKTEKEKTTKVVNFRNNERGEIEAAEIVEMRA